MKYTEVWQAIINYTHDCGGTPKAKNARAKVARDALVNAVDRAIDRVAQNVSATHLKDGTRVRMTAGEMKMEWDLAQLPIPMILFCPMCHARHIDKGEFATTRNHHTHACQSCGFTWRPAVVETVGVQFLPGFKDEI